MESSKRILLSTIFIAILVVMVTGLTFAFFNYTRTGVANNIRVGRIYFNTSQDGNIILTNVFPIASSEATGENTNYDSIEITITGDTTYSEGIEYLVTLTDVNNIVNNKKIPIAFQVEGTDIGTSSDDYFNERGGNTSVYLLTEKGLVREDKYILVGYIASGQTGINGSINITAYIDKDSIAISDTYPSGDVTHTESSGETSVEVADYTNNTTTDWINGRTVLTTEEWNSFGGNNSLSFKVKVEANEGIWVEQETTPLEYFTTHLYYYASYNENRTNEDIENCVSYLAEMGYDNRLNQGETLSDYCAGTGTLDSMTIQDDLESGNMGEYTLSSLRHMNIINYDLGFIIGDYDDNGETDVIIPEKMSIQRYVYNNDRTSEDIENCVNYFVNGSTSEDLIFETTAYCSGEVIPSEYYSLNDVLDFLTINSNSIIDEWVVTLENMNIIVSTTMEYPVIEIINPSGNNNLNAFTNKGLSSVVIPNTIKIIGENTFSNNQITSLTIPSSVETIGYNAFANNPITTLKIDMKEIPSIFSSNIGISTLTSVTIGENVTTIGNGAFNDNPNLTQIVVPDALYSSLTYNCDGAISAIANTGVIIINESGTNSCSIHNLGEVRPYDPVY